MAGWSGFQKSTVRSILPALRHLPPQVGSKLIEGIGRVGYAAVPGVGRAHREAVRAANDRMGCAWDIAAVARELAGNLARWRIRDILLDGRSDRQVDACFEVSGRTALDAGLARGRGVVLLGNHFGAHLLPAHWLFRREYPLRLYMERPRHVSKFMARRFDDEGPLGQKKLFISRRADPNESAVAILRATKALRSGMILLLAADVRWTGPGTASASFLGRSHTFSNTWVSLAAMTGATVVPVACRVDARGRYRVEFSPGYQIPNDAGRGVRSAEWVGRSLAWIEERVRLHPGNSNDYFFWDDSDPPPAAEPSDRRVRAA